MKHSRRALDGKWTPDLIETPLGPMTRRQIADAAGIPLNTVHSRVHRGVSGADLLRPATPHKQRPLRRWRGDLHTDGRYTECWADRKRRLSSAHFCP
jgi:hypothetical protein